MEKEVILPKISDNINSVTITEILVAIGDKVEVEDSLVTVESEKASLEVPSEFAGVVKKILIKEGDEVKIGATIIIIETEAVGKEDSKDAVKADESKTSSEESKMEIVEKTDEKEKRDAISDHTSEDIEVNEKKTVEPCNWKLEIQPINPFRYPL
jgi:pyruvate/2-oxoglutarate dehydrogenase complex dihydrolipoamide acyltransferase (E2) component